MEFKEFQEKARELAVYPAQQSIDGLVYTVLALSGEIGELANKLKKVLRGDYTVYETLPEMLAEMGDILWYLAATADELEVSLDDIASWNLEKLQERKEQRKILGSGDRR